ncbi:hypothetical protein OAK19_01730 [Aureispira]|nr:hypothetical protein [Aureispira sp.]
MNPNIVDLVCNKNIVKNSRDINALERAMELFVLFWVMHRLAISRTQKEEKRFLWAFKEEMLYRVCLSHVLIWMN